MGRYKNQVILDAPDWSRHKVIGVDACLKDEILTLWSAGIHTTGSCCGHNILKGMINVTEAHHSKMIELGYTHYTNAFEVLCYNPKSIDPFPTS